MNKHNENKSEHDSTKDSLISMVGSLAIVGLVIVFMICFNNYLKSHTYHGPGDPGNALEEEGEELLDYEKDFKSTYVVVKDVPKEGFYANVYPEKKDDNSVKLKDGQLLKVMRRGTKDHKMYYELEDGTFIDSNGKNVILLKSYEPRTGYIAITFISSDGVRLRKWPDFKDSNNVDKYVFVGDKIDITGKVETVKGVNAYVTSDGLYMTTDTEYFKDFTHSPDQLEENTTELEKTN